MTPRRKAPSAAPKLNKDGPRAYPHQLRAGDIITDEHGDAWELMGHPSKVVGAYDFTATVRRVDDPTETLPLRWKAHERVKVAGVRASGFWWPIRKSPTLVYLEPTSTSAGLYASNFKRQEGPSIAIAFEPRGQPAAPALRRQARGRGEGSGRGRHQGASAGPARRRPRRLHDPSASSGHPDRTPPWRVVIFVRG